MGDTTSASLSSRLSDWLTGANAPVTNGASVQAQPVEAKYSPDEVIVKFKSNIAIQPNGASSNQPALNQLFAKHQVASLQRVFPENFKLLKQDPRRPIGQLPDLSNVFRLKVAGGQDIKTLVAEYRQDPNVEYAEPNYTRSTQATTNDPLFSSQWALAKIQASAAWDVQQGDPNLVIAVVDTGIKYDHPDIAANSWTNIDEIPGDGVDNDGNGYIDDVYGGNLSWGYGGPTDLTGHGTWAAGVIGAVPNNGIGIAGLNWQSKIMAVKACVNISECTDSYTAPAIKYAVDNGARIINLSWGSYSSSSVLRDATLYAYNAGAILVAAAGNEGIREPFYPAAYPWVIAVGATDQADARVSNKGTWVRTYAPGVSIQTLNIDDGYAAVSGTSIAAPHVAGLVSLLLSQDSTRTISQIVNILALSADALGQTGDPLFGWGRINMSRALGQVSTADPNVKAFLTSPTPYQAFGQGQIDITGFASGSTFSSYSLSITAGESQSGFSTNGFTLVGGGTGQVSDGKLATLDTSTLTSAGIYTVKLSVTGSLGTSDHYLSIIYDPNLVPGWPKTVGMAYTWADTFVQENSVPTFADLAGDGVDKIIINSKNGSNSLTHVWDVTGAALWTNSNNGISDYPVAIGDLDLDGRNDVVAVAAGCINAWRGGDGSRLPNFPVILSGALTPSLGDINNDGSLEIIVPTDPNSYSGVSSIYYLNTAGRIVQTISLDPPSQIQSPVSLCDLNGDHNLAVIFGAGPNIYAYNRSAQPLWTKTLPNGITYPLTCADLNKDGFPEVIAGTSDNNLYVLDHNGNTIMDPKALSGYPSSGIPVDLNGDDSLDIVNVTRNDSINVWDRLGANLSPYPITASNRYAYGYGIISGSLSGSGSNEFLAPTFKDEGATANGGVHNGVYRLFNKNGEIANAEFPKSTLGYAGLAPAIGHPAADGASYLATSATYYSGTQVFLYKTPVAYDPQANPWPQYQHDARRTGSAGTDVTPPAISTIPVTVSPLSAPITVSAQITDNVGVRMGKIFYKNTSAAAYQFVQMNNISGSTYQGTIPADAAILEGVQYYLAAHDTSLNPTVAPSGAPDHLYNITIDDQPPVLSGAAVTSAPLGKPLTITVGASDNIGVQTVYLHYRTTGETTWQSVAMSGASGNYSATIPAAAIKRAGLEYYVEAADTAGLSAASPSGAPVSSYPVTVVDNLPPSAPSNLGTYPNVNQITLTFVPPTTNADGSPFADAADLAGYMIGYRDVTAGGAWLTIDNGPAISKVFTSLLAGHTYEFKVQAYDAADPTHNFSAWSAVASAVPLSPGTIPGPGPEPRPEVGVELPPEINPDGGVKPEVGLEAGAETPIVIVNDGGIADTALDVPIVDPDSGVEAGLPDVTTIIVYDGGIISPDAPVINPDSMVVAEVGQDAVIVKPNQDASLSEVALPVVDAGLAETSIPPVTKRTSSGCSCNLGGI